MKLIIFDVGNAFCSIISSPNGYGMMIDCGSNGDKDCPVALVQSNKEWLGLKNFVKSTGESYPLGLLHITHPDDDHVRNAKKIKEELEPYLLQRTRFEEFPDGDKIHDEYKEHIDKQYRGSNPEKIDWGFDENKTFQIPMDVLKADENLSKKLRNNSSIVRFISHNGTRILYTGDLETPAWEWLVKNNQSFVNTIKNGVDIFIAPHHGHNSGFPQCLFNIVGNVKMIIHSKGSEASIEGTDVSNKYSENADGVTYKNLKDEELYTGKVLTTRSNGHIYVSIGNSSFNVWTSKASCNHDKIV
jgi:hypothetical protein